MNKTLTLFALGLLLFAGGLQAQEKSKKELRKEKREEKKALSQRYMILGFGSGWANVLDLQMSNARYGGPAVMAEWRRWDINPKDKHDMIWARTSAAMTTASHGAATMNMVMPETRYTYTRNIRDLGKKGGKIRFGGYVSLMGNFRDNPSLGNSSVYWDLIPSIGPAADLDLPFTFPWFKTQSLFTYQLATSIFAYLNSLPIYSLSSDGTANYFLPFGRQGRVMSEASLIVPIRRSNANKFKLSYNWEFYGYRETEIFNARFGQHTLLFSLMVNLHSSQPKS